jgi:hypothetical protein
VGETIHNTAHAVTAEDVLAAMRAADAEGQRRLARTRQCAKD